MVAYGMTKRNYTGEWNAVSILIPLNLSPYAQAKAALGF